MISKYNDITTQFEKVEKRLTKKVKCYVIGGAALLHHSVGKGFTKDIDVVFNTAEEYRLFSEALKKDGFTTKAKPLTHDKLKIWEVLVKNDYRFDLFVKQVVGHFSLSETMMQRAIPVQDLENLIVFICSKEDIVVFKSISPDRPNDVEDSIDLIKRGVNWNTIFEELLTQTKICPDNKKAKELVWYFLERINDLESKGVHVPVKSKIEQLFDSMSPQ